MRFYGTIIIFAFFVLLCALPQCLFADAEINGDNYIEFIGHRIKFEDNLKAGEKYSIAGKIFNEKIYKGQMLTISNIKFDKNENITLVLTHERENGNIDSLECSAKSRSVYLKNISVEGHKSIKNEPVKNNDAEKSVDKNNVSPITAGSKDGIAKQKKTQKNKVKSNVSGNNKKQKKNLCAGIGFWFLSGLCCFVLGMIFGIKISKGTEDKTGEEAYEYEEDDEEEYECEEQDECEDE